VKKGGAKMTKLLGITVALVVLVGGCVQDPVTELSDSDNIHNLLSSNGTVEMRPLEGRGEDEGGKDGNHPEVWFRQRTYEEAFEVILENDPSTGICTVTVVRNLFADFYIDVVHDEEFNPGIKPISDIRTRRAIVERHDDVSVHGGWVLTHITPAEYSLNSDIPQEVFIQSMKIYKGDDLTWECDSPDTFYDVETGLPLIESGELVRLEVEVLHTNPQYDPEFYLFVHGPCPSWPRHFMNDEGLWGDRVAGDDVYSYEWYAEASSEHWFIAADIIDADTMLDQEEDDYDSGAWGIIALME
jgi:hypothetical protein